MTWQPPERDIDPFEKLLSLAVRDTILAHPAGNGGAAQTWRELRSDGMALNLLLRVAPREAVSHQGRAALTYDVGGEALSGRTGYRCEGRAVIDLKTRAFLDVTCRLVPVGAV
ncbi:hypothetical protein [Aquabacter cavernae]|uniref:hypothetical protein n=1 Tax=Aquabacter cavernae TaxID=2496029 RepID=UPI000F8F5964|nr:hypothetical protein [Aquabacter cavernae]